jgi:hypothetical protein
VPSPSAAPGAAATNGSAGEMLSVAFSNPDIWAAIVLGLGAVLLMTALQISKTYPGFATTMHRALPTWALYVVNAVVVSALLIGFFIGNPKLTWLSGVLVGFGLPIVLQTRIVVAKPVGKAAATGLGAPDVAIPVQELYERAVGSLRQRMDLALEFFLQDRIFPEVLAKYPDDDGVEALRVATINALGTRTFTPEEREVHRKYIDGVVASRETNDNKKKLLARTILSLTSARYLDRLVKGTLT